MKRLFDHLFFRIYWWNIKIVKDSDFPIFSALIGLAFFHSLNITTLIFVILIMNDWQMLYHKWVHLFLLFLILLIDFFIYVYKGKSNEIIEVEGLKDKRSIIKKDIAILIYMIVSIILFFLVVIIGK